MSTGITILNPGPAPGLVNDWLSWPFVLTVVIIFVIWFVAYTIHAIKADLPSDIPQPPRCSIGNCRRLATNRYWHPSGGVLICDSHAKRIQRPRYEDAPQWGVMFHDGSVRHPWNGRTAQDHARAEALRLHRDYGRDNIRLVYRENRDAPWMIVPY